VSKRITALVLAACFSVFALSGCSGMLEGIASKKVEKEAESLIEEFIADPTGFCEEYDDDYDASLIDGAVADLIENGLSGVSFEISSVNLNKSRSKAEVEINFEDVRVIEDISLVTREEISDIMDECVLTDEDITLIFTRHEADWNIKSVEPLMDLFIKPYESVVFVGDNGMPESYSSVFFEETVVDTIWYDPLMSNPITDKNPSLESPEALEAVVYFNRPMYLTLTCDLLFNGEKVQTIELTLDGQTVADCDFWGESYREGSYTVNVYYDDGLVASSDALTVNR